MLYVGVDLHRNVSHVTALDHEGEVVLSRRIGSRRPEFFKVFEELGDQPIEVAFEATFGWGWFADFLGELGLGAHMAHPLQTKAISSARVKNDAVDAKTLANLLRTNYLPEAWIAPLEVRELRKLVRVRATLVRLRTRLKQQVSATLADHGLNIEAYSLWSAKGQKLLSETELPPISRARVDACVRLITGFDAEISVAERELVAAFAGDDRVRRLMPIPGIGFLTAATLVAEIWDITRFPSADHLCSWAGLTPGEHSSADHIRRGHITRQGSPWVRWVLVEAAATPRATRPQEFNDLLDRIAKRRGRHVARVALARRLLILAFHALRSPTGCRAFPISS